MDLDAIFTHTISSRAMRKEFIKILTSHNVIYGEFEILYLLEGDETLNPTVITSRLNCQPAATSRLIKSLHQRNFVEYDHKVDDRRQVLVSLSAQGRVKMDDIRGSCN